MSVNPQRHITHRGWPFLATLLSTALALISEPSAAQVAGPCSFDPSRDHELSLRRATELALCRNADIELATATVRVREAQLGEARSEYWPNLSVTTTELHEHTSYPGSQLPAQTTDGLTIYGALAYRLYDFGRRSNDNRAASFLLEAALSNESATIQKILSRTVENYFDAVTARAVLESDLEDKRFAEEILASANRRVTQGEGAQSDALQARTLLARAALETSRARGNSEKSIAVLSYTLGVPQGSNFTVMDPEHSTSENQRSLDDWLHEAQFRHPAIAAARAELEAAQAQENSTRAAGLPTLDLQANYYANGFPQQGLTDSHQRSATVGISVTIPLFDGFLTQHRVHEAQANVDVKRTYLIDTERATFTEIVRAYSDATVAVANLSDSQTLLEAARAAQASSKRRYDSGVTDILELLETQRALSDARAETAKSLAEWHSARLRLLAASGLLSQTDTPP